MDIGAAVFAIDEITENINKGFHGIVKQVASGVYESSSVTDASDVPITTGITVNPAKTIVILNSGTTASVTTEFDAYLMPSILVAKTETTITISPPLLRRANGTMIRGRTSWQILEFF